MNRDERIDIIRGMSMILIVLGHAGFPMKSYIYLFHVAVFFIIAGVCWKDGYSDGIKEMLAFVKKRVCSLYLPYVAWLCFFTLLHNFFLHIHFYSDNEQFLEGKIGNSFGLVYSYSAYDFVASVIKNFLFWGNEPVAGASWFIRCLFFLVILWTSVDFIIKKVFHSTIHVVRLIISLFFLGVGNYLCIKEVFWPGNLATIFSVYILFYIGVYYKGIADKFKNTFYESRICKRILIIICVVLLAIMDTIGNIELSMNKYDNVLFFITSSIIGWIFLIEIASIVRNDRAKKLFVIIGQNTMWILFLHFLVFKFINVLQVAMYELPLYRIASYPTLYTDKGWWILYTIAGVVVPICIKHLIQKLLNRWLRIVEENEKIANNKNA